MNVYLMRHGDAVYQNPDDLSPLSDRGKEAIDAVAKFILPLKLTLRVFHSQKLRAKQTAERISAGIILDAPMIGREGLNPNDSVISMAEELDEADSDVLLIGHMPFMGRLVSQLLYQNADHDVVSFHKGTLLCLKRIGYGQWILEWVIHPGIVGGTNE